MKLTPPFPINDLREALLLDSKQVETDSLLFDTLVSQEVPPLVTTETLSTILGVSHKLLWAMASVPDRYYRQFHIPKRRGGSRQIATPRVFLKVVQRWILLNILYVRQMPPFVTGFTPGRGLLDNASFHVGKRHLLKIDIQDFFPSIGFLQVERVFREFGFPSRVVSLLTKLCLLNGVLPQGAPTSPQLANLVFLPCDMEISALAEDNRLSYSRYADDLTFSSLEAIPPGFVRDVINLIERHMFRVNPEKLKLAGPGQRLMTTGMVVNVDAHPMRQVRRQLRARFHQANLNPSQFTEQAHQLVGWAAYVNMYDHSTGSEYLAIAKKVLEATGRVE